MSSPRRHTHTQPHRKTGLCSRLAAHTPPLPQVAFADRILLNKTDLVSEEDLLRVEKRLKSINSQAPVQRCTKAEVSPDWVLDIGAFDLKRVIEMDPEFLNTDGEMWGDMGRCGEIWARVWGGALHLMHLVEGGEI